MHSNLPGHFPGFRHSRRSQHCGLGEGPTTLIGPAPVNIDVNASPCLAGTSTDSMGGASLMVDSICTGEERLVWLFCFEKSMQNGKANFKQKERADVCLIATKIAPKTGFLAGTCLLVRQNFVLSSLVQIFGGRSAENNKKKMKIL